MFRLFIHLNIHRG